MRTYLRFAAILVLFIATSSTAKSQPAKLDGTWKMSVETSAGNGSPTFELKQGPNNEITGTYKGQLGEFPVTGKRDGNKVSFSFEVQGTQVEYSGTVDGDTMQGIVKLGSMGDGKFTGKRSN